MAKGKRKRKKDYTSLEVYQKLSAFKLHVETFFEETEERIRSRQGLSPIDSEEMVFALDAFEVSSEEYNELIASLGLLDEEEFYDD